MNYQPNPYGVREYDVTPNTGDERVIPLLTGFALGAPFWGNINRPYRYPYPYQYPYPYPYSYPYNYSYGRPYRRRRRWY